VGSAERTTSGRQGYDREVMAEGSRYAKHRPDRQKSHTRWQHRIRRHESSKSNICTEGVGVNVAGISVEVSVHYLGRSAVKA